MIQFQICELRAVATEMEKRWSWNVGRSFHTGRVAGRRVRDSWESSVQVLEEHGRVTGKSKPLSSVGFPLLMMTSTVASLGKRGYFFPPKGIGSLQNLQHRDLDVEDTQPGLTEPPIQEGSSAPLPWLPATCHTGQ